MGLIPLARQSRGPAIKYRPLSLLWRQNLSWQYVKYNTVQPHVMVESSQETDPKPEEERPLADVTRKLSNGDWILAGESSQI
jgi:hypothetical protein